MKTTIRQHRNSAALVLGAVAALVLAGCGAEAPTALETGEADDVAEPGPQVSDKGPVDDNGDEVIQLEDALGEEIATVFSQDANKKLTIDLDDAVVGAAASSVTLSVANGVLTVNGFPLSHKLLAANASPVNLKPADVKLIEIKTVNDYDKIVLDSLGGALGSSTVAYATGGMAAATGIIINTGTKKVEVSLRGTAGADSWKAAQTADSVYFETTGDKKVDVQVTGAGALDPLSEYTVALADGNDSFNALAFGPLAAVSPPAGITAVLDSVANLTSTGAALMKPLSVGVTVYGGAGNDTLVGGFGDDAIFGGAGADVYKAASAAEIAAVGGGATDDGDDEVNGGADLDKVDYSGRTAKVRLVLDGVTKAGNFTIDMMTLLPVDGELDVLATDLEDISGGEGNDILTGNKLPNKILGGKGNDTISGGEVANNSCKTPMAMSADPPKNVDSLDGGEGDDTFDMDTVMGSMGAVETTDCGTTVIGGLGTDTVDYSKRTTDVQISLDGKASSGQVTDATATPVSGVLLTHLAEDASVFGTLKADIENAIGSKAAENRILGSTSDNVLTGGDVVDFIDGLAGNDTMAGGLLGDTLKGSGGNDIIDGEAGADTIEGGDGDDALSGGDGVDSIKGGIGNDTFKGGAGADVLNGEAGDDVFNEGEETGMDAMMMPIQLIHGADDDVINGGAGTNKLTYAGRLDIITAVMCNDAAVLLGAGAMGTTCPARPAMQDTILNVSHLIGGTLGDTLTGTTATDLIEGGAGGDTISGGAGNDRLYGDADGDTVSGDAGDDSVEGGAGDDVLDGDNTMLGNVGEDICVSDAADMTTPAVNCEL